MKQVLLAHLMLVVLLGAAPADDYDLHEWGFFVENGDQDVLDIEAGLPAEVPSFRDPRQVEDPTAATTGRVTREALGMSTVPITTAETRRILRGPLVVRTVADPFLHFHTDRPMDVAVRVQFPQGAPMFWWPVADEVGDDYLLWRRIRIGVGDDQPLHRFSGSVARRAGVERARRVDSSTIEKDDVRDRYAFYDGTMTTDSIVRRWTSWDGLHLANATNAPVLDLVVFDGRGARLLEPLGPGEEIVVTADSGRLIDFDEEWLRARLVDAGLESDEAAAMSWTLWRTGFFEADGVRVLYRLDQATYDQIFPIALEPAPRRVVRVGVVLSHDLDHAIRAAVRRMAEFRDRPEVVASLDAQLRRLVGARITNLEPLSAAMRAVLDLPGRRMASLRALIQPVAGRPVPVREIETMIAEARDPLATADERRTAAGRLVPALRAHLYSGGSMTPAVEDFLASRERPAELNDALGVPVELVD